MSLVGLAELVLQEPTLAHAWGVVPERVVLRDQYDGIFFVDTTNPPTPLF